MTVQLATIPELITEIYDPVFAELLQRNLFFLSRMPAKGKSAEKIKWRAHIGGNDSAGSYGETDDLGPAGNQSYMIAELAWKLNKVRVEITGLAQAVSSGPGFVRNLLQNELSEALPDLQQDINSQLLSDGTGNGGKDVTGIYAAIDDGSVVSEYAGIDRGSQPLWCSYVNENSGTDRELTLDLMRDVMRTVESHPRNGQVTAIYCDSTLWDAYGRILIGAQETKRSYVDNIQVLAGGYRALIFEGRPVINVPGWTAKRMDFVDERWFTYWILKNFVTEALAKVKDVDSFFTKHYSQFQCKDPYKQGSLRDVIPAELN